MTSSMGGFTGHRGPAGSGLGLKGTGYKAASLQQFTPEQMQLFQSLFSHLSPGGDLAKLAGGDQSAFEQIEAPALRQFGELQGQLASRFSGMGMGARRSSGFQQAGNSAAIELAERLQSQRLGLQRQALEDLMGMSSQLLSQRPYEQFLMPKKQSLAEKLLESLFSGLGGGISGLPGAFIK